VRDSILKTFAKFWVRRGDAFRRTDLVRMLNNSGLRQLEEPELELEAS